MCKNLSRNTGVVTVVEKSAMFFYVSQCVTHYCEVCPLRWHFSVDADHSIVRTVRQYSICQACFLLFCSGHLELSAKNSY